MWVNNEFPDDDTMECFVVVNNVIMIKEVTETHIHNGTRQDYNAWARTYTTSATVTTCDRESYFPTVTYWLSVETKRFF